MSRNNETLQARQSRIYATLLRCRTSPLPVPLRVHAGVRHGRYRPIYDKPPDCTRSSASMKPRTPVPHLVRLRQSPAARSSQPQFRLVSLNRALSAGVFGGNSCQYIGKETEKGYMPDARDGLQPRETRNVR